MFSGIDLGQNVCLNVTFARDVMNVSSSHLERVVCCDENWYSVHRRCCFDFNSDLVLDPSAIFLKVWRCSSGNMGSSIRAQFAWPRKLSG